MSITIDQFKEIEMRVGLVVEASEVEGSTKLIKLIVDFGPDDKKTIFTGVRPFGYTPDYFLNKKWLFVTNLEPKVMPYFASGGATKGEREESQGMILAVDGADGKPVFVVAESEVEVGSRVR